MRDGAVVPTINSAEVAVLIENGVAGGGMAPKLLAAASASLQGVGEVRIGGMDLLASLAGGTRLVTGAPVAAVA
jgi:acetylglutamate kinase